MQNEMIWVSGDADMKNGWIELSRFVAAWIIVFFHVGHAPYLTETGDWGKFYSGGLFVEFFFLLTGYFAVAHIEKNHRRVAGQEAAYIGKYMLNKWRRFLPYTFFSCLMVYPSFFLKYAYTKSDILRALPMFPLDVLMLKNTGINFKSYNGYLWYISAMILVLPVVLFLFSKFKAVTSRNLMWMIPLSIYGYLVREIGTVRTTAPLESTLRCFAGLLLGGALYVVSQRIHSFSFTKLGKFFVSAVEITTFLIAIYYTTIPWVNKSYYDVVFIMIVFVSLLCSFSGQSVTQNLHGRIIKALGSLSLPIYLVHPAVMRFVTWKFEHSGLGAQMGYTVIGTVLASLACLLFAERIWPAVAVRVKRMLVVEHTHEGTENLAPK